MLSPGESSLDTVIYSTSSLCPTCLLGEQKGIQWKPATVEEREGHIWIVCRCEDHGEHVTHYCSNPSFFRKVMKYGSTRKNSTVVDIEDVASNTKIFPEKLENQPLVIDLAVFRSGSFLDDKEIKEEAARLLSLAPKGKKFIVKIVAKLAKDMTILNAKAHVVEECFPCTPVLMEVSFERLVALSQLEDSIFLRPWVYPALKYFLQKGDELLCLRDIQKMFKYVGQFSGIQIVITLGVNRPFPDLKEILHVLRQKSDFVRCIILSHERPVRLIRAQSSPEDLAKAKNEIEEDTIVRTKVAEKKKTIVKSGKRYCEMREVTKVGSVIEWEFRPEERDITFSIEYKELHDIKENKITLLSANRYLASEGVAKGIVEVSKPGVYYFHWDNSYSRIRKKVIHWSVTVHSPRKDDIGNKGVNVPVDSLDPYDLLLSIEDASEGTLITKDFFPLSGASVLEPFLAALGYGSFSIRPSPFCCFAAILVNTESVRSVPLTRYIDFDIFHSSAAPLLSVWSSGSFVENIKMVTRVKKILKKSSVQTLPDIVSYLTESKKAEDTKKFLKNVQLLLVHNNMDVAGVDMVRRCNCSALSAQSRARQGLVASCLGCV